MDNYHLLYDSDRWKLKIEGGTRSVGEYERKTEAVADSHRIVSERGGSLQIHGTDGTIEEERNYLRKTPG